MQVLRKIFKLWLSLDIISILIKFLTSVYIPLRLGYLIIGNTSGRHSIKKEMQDILSPHRYVEVEVKTLDQLMDELKLSRVSFIKIDAEGAELYSKVTRGY